MELYILVRVTYDHFRFQDNIGVFEKVEKAKLKALELDKKWKYIFIQKIIMKNLTEIKNLTGKYSLF